MGRPGAEDENCVHLPVAVQSLLLTARRSRGIANDGPVWSSVDASCRNTYSLEADRADHNWRLPADTDLQQLRSQITEAMQHGETATLKIEMQENPLVEGTLVINGKALHYVGFR